MAFHGMTDVEVWNEFWQCIGVIAERAQGYKVAITIMHRDRFGFGFSNVSGAR